MRPRKIGSRCEARKQKLMQLIGDALGVAETDTHNVIKQGLTQVRQSQKS